VVGNKILEETAGCILKDGSVSVLQNICTSLPNHLESEIDHLFPSGTEVKKKVRIAQLV
jgi:hypothetical protein